MSAPSTHPCDGCGTQTSERVCRSCWETTDDPMWCRDCNGVCQQKPTCSPMRQDNHGGRAPRPRAHHLPPPEPRRTGKRRSMSPAPHADRDHSEQSAADIANAFNAHHYGIEPPTFAEPASLEAEVNGWARRWHDMKAERDAAEAELDRARSLVATLEARLAQVEADVERLTRHSPEHESRAVVIETLYAIKARSDAVEAKVARVEALSDENDTQWLDDIVCRETCGKRIDGVDHARIASEVQRVIRAALKGDA